MKREITSPTSRSDRRGHVVWSISCIVVALLAIATIAYLKLGQVRPPLAVATPESQRIVADPGSTQVFASYQITNHGGRKLAIGEISTSCGCSVASIERRILAPGQSTTVKVEGTPPGAGEKTVEVRIATNSETKPELVLTLAMVGSLPLPYVSVRPEVLNLGVARADGEPRAFYLETRERQDQAPWIQSAECTIPELRIRGGMEAEESLSGGVVLRRYQFTATLSQLPASLAGEVLIRTKGPDKAVVHRIPLLGTIPAPVQVAPRAVFARFKPRSEMPRITVILTADDPEFVLDAMIVRDSLDPIVVRRISQTKNHAEFEVSLLPDCIESIKTALVFKTNHPNASDVRIPTTFQWNDGQEAE